MKKIILILILGAVVATVLSLYIYSYARTKATLPRPENTLGVEASASLPRQIEDKPASPGSDLLKPTGPVWVEK